MSMKVQIIDNDNGEVLLDCPDAVSVVLATVDAEGHCTGRGILRDTLSKFVGAAYAVAQLVEQRKAADPVFAALYECCAMFCEPVSSKIQEVQ